MEGSMMSIRKEGTLRCIWRDGADGLTGKWIVSGRRIAKSIAWRAPERHDHHDGWLLDSMRESAQRQSETA